MPAHQRWSRGSATAGRRLTLVAVAVAIAAATVEFVTMFLVRAEGKYSEDFLITYRPDARLHGPVSADPPYDATAFLFLYPMILELLLLAAVVGIALLVAVRPGQAAAARRYALAAGLGLVAVAVANVVAPSWGSIEFWTRDAAYAALVAAVIAATAMLLATVPAGRSTPSATERADDVPAS